ncbi:hypothetical protein PPL_07066 [Heterostelium album PN500]|uniref:SP-RING-type domain-containing protein n=1 Tax=Heterostelium pallidum (strain ATCC 26659 / Pp 5 / PN500) TaxID=670386 RepID=D3BEB0_HETP5|nr:hypothetical protein PPL_07066 [Heterostelium album PN500]EFA80241.1 hypothetical protein PPL_07066 [Heterostelium album PN500]|eukprot:XP_020432361.1 hypothetical protein PPL_07066 [Heterostelium album PN500]
MESLPRIEDIESIDKTYASLQRLLTSHKHNITQSALSLESEDEQLCINSLILTTIYNPQAAQLDQDFLKCLYEEQFIAKHKQDIATLKQYIERTHAQLRQNQHQPTSQPPAIRDPEEFIKHGTMLRNIDTGLEALKQNKEFKEYKQKIWNINHTEPFDDGGNEDIFIASQTISIICPITKKNFENPVKSRTCGHTFSKEAIQSMFRRSTSISCPVVGCSHQITQNGLERDIVMEETVKRELRKKSREVQKDPDDITEL